MADVAYSLRSLLPSDVNHKVIADAQKAVDLVRSARNMYLLACLKSNMRKFIDESVELLSDVIEKDEEFVCAYKKRAELPSIRIGSDQSILDLFKYLKYREEDTEARILLSMKLFAFSRFEQSIEVVSEGLIREPNSEKLTDNALNLFVSWQILMKPFQLSIDFLRATQTTIIFGFY
jgi:hypothetical protein